MTDIENEETSNGANGAETAMAAPVDDAMFDDAEDAQPSEKDGVSASDMRVGADIRKRQSKLFKIGGLIPITMDHTDMRKTDKSGKTITNGPVFDVYAISQHKDYLGRPIPGKQTIWLGDDGLNQDGKEHGRGTGLRQLRKFIASFLSAEYPDADSLYEFVNSIPKKDLTKAYVDSLIAGKTAFGQIGPRAQGEGKPGASDQYKYLRYETTLISTVDQFAAQQAEKDGKTLTYPISDILMLYYNGDKSALEIKDVFDAERDERKAKDQARRGGGSEGASRGGDTRTNGSGTQESVKPATTASVNRTFRSRSGA